MRQVGKLFIVVGKGDKKQNGTSTWGMRGTWTAGDKRPGKQRVEMERDV